jgi:hypothetical protein
LPAFFAKRTLSASGWQPPLKSGKGVTRTSIRIRIPVNMRTQGFSIKTEKDQMINQELLDEEELRLAGGNERADEDPQDKTGKAGKDWHSFQTY